MNKAIKQTILVTGGTAGIGYHTATQLAQQFRNATIIIASRKDTDSASATIKTKTGHTDVHFLPLDLGNQQKVRDFVQDFAQKSLPPISLLLLNAGSQFPNEIQYTPDKIEATFGINHVGHALLLHLLLPFLATEARIVITASGTHDPAQKSGMPVPKYISAEDLAHPSGDSLRKPGQQRYTESKFANVLWMYALHKRLSKVQGKHWTVVAMDPGLMPGTGLAREYGPVLRFVWNHVLPRLIPLMRALMFSNIWKPQDSAANLAWIATDEKTSGVYYEGKKQIKSSVDSYDESKQEDLWAWTVKALARDEREAKEFQIVDNA